MKTKSGRSKYKTYADKEQIEKLYHLPLPKAAKTLGVSVTKMKKMCRLVQIKSWPYKRKYTSEKKSSSSSSVPTSPQTTKVDDDKEKIIQSSVEDVLPSTRDSHSEKDYCESSSIDKEQESKCLNRGCSPNTHAVKEEEYVVKIDKYRYPIPYNSTVNNPYLYSNNYNRTMQYPFMNSFESTVNVVPKVDEKRCSSLNESTEVKLPPIRSILGNEINSSKCFPLNYYDNSVESSTMNNSVAAYYGNNVNFSNGSSVQREHVPQGGIYYGNAYFNGYNNNIRYYRQN